MQKIKNSTKKSHECFGNIRLCKMENQLEEKINKNHQLRVFLNDQISKTAIKLQSTKIYNNYNNSSLKEAKNNSKKVVS